MKTIAFDNSCDADLNRTITWQFDKAAHFVGIINLLKDFVNQSTKTFWDDIVTMVGNIDTADEFGLAVWGRLLNLQRPVLTTESTVTDPNVFYCKYIGKLDKVNSAFPKGSATGKTFYYHNQNYDLVPYAAGSSTYWYIWSSTETEFENGYVGIVMNSTDNPTSLDFEEFYDEGGGTFVPEGGAVLGHTYPQTSQQSLTLANYRKILKGRFALLNGNTVLGIVGNASVSDYCKYIAYVFDGKVIVSDSLDMALTFTKKSSLTGEMAALFDQFMDVIIPYPAGVHDNVLSNSFRFGLVSAHTSESYNVAIADHKGRLANESGTNDYASSFSWNNKVVFNENYGATPTVTTVYVENGNHLSLLTPSVRIGYNFEGWYTSDGTQPITDPYVVTSSLYLFAHWTATT